MSDFSNEQRTELENEIKSILSNFITVNNKRMQLKLFFLNRGLKEEKQLESKGISTSLLRYVGYMSEDFSTAANYFGNLHESLKEVSYGGCSNHFMLRRRLRDIKQITTAVTTCIEQYKSDNIIWCEESEVFTEQSTQTDFISQSNQSTQVEKIDRENKYVECNLIPDEAVKMDQGTQCEQIKSENKFASCNLQTDIIEKNEKTTEVKNCDFAHSSKIEKTLVMQSTNTQNEKKHRKNKKQQNKFINEVKQNSSRPKMDERNFDFNVKTQNRFDTLPIERCEWENLHRNYPRNLKRSPKQQSTQDEKPKIHSKNSFNRQSEWNQNLYCNKNFTKNACKSENNRNITYSNKCERRNSNNWYSSALQMRKWHEQQQQKQIFFNQPKKRKYERLNYRENDDNAMNRQSDVFNKISVAKTMFRIIVQWIYNEYPEKYHKSSMNRQKLAEKMRIFI